MSPAAPEGWALILVFVLIAVTLPLLVPHHWWIIYPVLAVLLIVIFLKGASPGGAREWAEFQASKDRGDGDPSSS